MTEELFVAFLKHFHNLVKSTKDKPCLLVLDNHSSHLFIEGLNFAKEKGIIMLPFPPHCTHRLEPLDRSVFGPLKEYVNNAMVRWLLKILRTSNNDRRNTRNNCIGFPASSNIVVVLKNCGSCLFNPDIFQKYDFMPSSVRQTTN